MERKKDMVFLNGKMVLFITDSFTRIIYMDMETIAGRTEGSI